MYSEVLNSQNAQDRQMVDDWSTEKVQAARQMMVDDWSYELKGKQQ